MCVLIFFFTYINNNKEHVEEAMSVLRFALTNDTEPEIIEQRRRRIKEKNRHGNNSHNNDGNNKSNYPAISFNLIFFQILHFKKDKKTKNKLTNYVKKNITGDACICCLLSNFLNKCVFIFILGWGGGKKIKKKQQQEDDINESFYEDSNDENEESEDSLSHASKKQKVCEFSGKAPEDGVELSLGDWNFWSSDNGGNKSNVTEASSEDSKGKEKRGTNENENDNKKDKNNLDLLTWTLEEGDEEEEEEEEEEEAIAWAMDIKKEPSTSFLNMLDNSFAFDSNDLQWGTEVDIKSTIVPIVELKGNPLQAERNRTPHISNVMSKLYLFDTEGNNKTIRLWKQHGDGELFLCRQHGTGFVRLNCPITNHFSCKIVGNDRVQFVAPILSDTETSQKDLSSLQNQSSSSSSVKLALYCIRVWPYSLHLPSSFPPPPPFFKNLFISLQPIDSNNVQDIVRFVHTIQAENAPKNQTQNETKAQKQESSKEQPKEQPKGQPKEQSKEQPKAQPKAHPKKQTKEQTKNTPKSQPKSNATNKTGSQNKSKSKNQTQVAPSVK
ncbi:penicillin-binding protein 2 [Reticulomyxa filosa]|uniref:Penicillin-binding protein 2 n=1 Tax=Reticulomyxa filosa TaxID=46433 RepID=X6P2S8_RETFI|nr:penicillin-binding protein 2 [Reticulomyxa filosa]|eukprot:ETO32536.1 penicillin-binding protein 2 [Reticulomyxa filosa]